MRELKKAIQMIVQCETTMQDEYLSKLEFE